MGLPPGLTSKVTAEAKRLGRVGICANRRGRGEAAAHAESEAAFDAFLALARKRQWKLILSSDLMTKPMVLPHRFDDAPTPGASVEASLVAMRRLVVDEPLARFKPKVLAMHVDNQQAVQVRGLKGNTQKKRSDQAKDAVPYPEGTRFSRTEGVVLPEGVDAWPPAEHDVKLTKAGLARAPAAPGYFDTAAMFHARKTRLSYWNAFKAHLVDHWRAHPLPDGVTVLFDFCDGALWVYEAGDDGWTLARGLHAYDEADQALIATPLRWATEVMGLQRTQVAFVVDTIDTDIAVSLQLMLGMLWPGVGQRRAERELAVLWVRWSYAATDPWLFRDILSGWFGSPLLQMLAMGLISVDFVDAALLWPDRVGVSQREAILRKVLHPDAFREDVEWVLRHEGLVAAMDLLVLLCWAKFYALRAIDPRVLSREYILKQVPKAALPSAERFAEGRAQTVDFMLYWLMTPDGTTFGRTE